MGDVVGPLNGSDLRSHAASGRITTDTFIRKGANGQWVLADRIKGLFDQPAPQEPPPLPEPVTATLVSDPRPETDATVGPVFSMTGVQDLLEVFDDHVAISPKGIMGFLNKGLKGTKEIPFSSVIAVQFKEAGSVFSGYLQFTIPGGNESRGGIMAATKDENTFMFAHTKNNALAKEIKGYIDVAIRNARSPKSTMNSASLSGELQKLAELNKSGLLSDDEFQAAKRKLIS